MLRENLGLITSRQMDKSGIEPVFITNSIIDAHSITSAVSISYLFPLYLYEEKEPPKKRKSSFGSMMILFEEKAEYSIKKPNISPALIDALTKCYKKPPSPEDVFHYIYAVLYSNAYRTKYAEFLKSDFPRAPFTRDHKLFKKLGEYGRELAELHLLKAKTLNKPSVKFQGRGEHRVKKPTYDSKSKKVHINEGQCFEGISSDVWDYHIGGYRVMEKWLKERAKAGRTLAFEDIAHFCRMASAIEETIELQKNIDKLYGEAEKDAIEPEIKP
jgi:predicted helicase